MEPRGAHYLTAFCICPQQTHFAQKVSQPSVTPLPKSIGSKDVALALALLVTSIECTDDVYSTLSANDFTTVADPLHA